MYLSSLSVSSHLTHVVEDDVALRLLLLGHDQHVLGDVASDPMMAGLRKAVAAQAAPCDVLQK